MPKFTYIGTNSAGDKVEQTVKRQIVLVSTQLPGLTGIR